MADLHEAAPPCAPMGAVEAPSEAPQAVIAAITAWREGEHELALEILERLGCRAVAPLFGFYTGHLIEMEERGEDPDLMLREMALDLALQRCEDR